MNFDVETHSGTVYEFRGNTVSRRGAHPSPFIDSWENLEYKFYEELEPTVGRGFIFQVKDYPGYLAEWCPIQTTQIVEIREV